MKKFNESVWGTMLDRSTGDSIRKEDDVNLLDLDGLYDYIKSEYEKYVFYLDKTWYNEIYVDVLTNISLILKPNGNGGLLHVLLSWSKEKISMPFFDKLSERFKVVNPSANRRIITEKDGTCTNKTYIDVIDFFLENIDNMLVESVWGGMLDRSVGDSVRKEDDIELLDMVGLYEYILSHYELTDNRFEMTYGTANMSITISNNGDEILLTYKFEEVHCFFNLAKYSRLYSALSKKFYIDTTDDTHYIISPKDECTNQFYIDVLDCIIENRKTILRKKVVNESVWGGMLDRSTGISVRKEDGDFVKDIKLDIKKFTIHIVYEDLYKNTPDDFRVFMSKSWRNHMYDRITHKNVGKEKVEKIVHYTIANWTKGENYESQINDLIKKEEEKLKKLGFVKEPGKSVDETLNDWWESYNPEIKKELMDETNYELDYEDRYEDPEDMWRDTDYETKIEMYVDANKTNESVWGGLLNRSVGDADRKEDEVLTDTEINSLNEFTLMYCRGERAHYIQNHIVPPPPSRRKENDYEGLIKYIENRRDENLFTNVGDYNKIIRYIKKNWDRLDMDTYIKKWICSPDVMKGKRKIVECEGVPGGATPANVGGMGAAYFPGPNGEPGSGDLPSPTGIVYKQVAPFTTFLKQIKKKKKKTKKFRKEDEPCVHSENPPIYSHVDDFRDYVDRVYNQIDRKK